MTPLVRNHDAIPPEGGARSDIRIRGASRGPILASGILLLSLVVFGAAASHPSRAEACSCMDELPSLLVEIDSVEVDGVPQTDLTGYEWGHVVLNNDGLDGVTLVAHASQESGGASIFEETYVSQ